MPELLIRGARIHYEDEGDADETILFAHGLLWSGEMFRPQIDALRRRYRCVSFDFRGQGRSEVTAGGYDMDALTEDTLGLVAALCCAPCHVVGLSMGGFVGLRLAIRHPAIVRSLVLVESAADAEPALNVPKYKAMGWIGRAVGLEPLAREVTRVMFGRSFLEDPARAELREELRRRLVAVDTLGAMRATDGVIFRRSVERELGAIRAPTLVLHGDEDAAIAPARARRTADAIPGARFVALPRAGHTSTLEEPDAVIDALRGFFEGVGRRASSA